MAGYKLGNINTTEKRDKDASQNIHKTSTGRVCTQIFGMIILTRKSHKSISSQSYKRSKYSHKMALLSLFYETVSLFGFSLFASTVRILAVFFKKYLTELVFASNNEVSTVFPFYCSLLLSLHYVGRCRQKYSLSVVGALCLCCLLPAQPSRANLKQK